MHSKSSTVLIPRLVEKKSVDMVADTTSLETLKKEPYFEPKYSLVTDREFQLNQQVNTGIDVNPGNSVVITARGFVSMGPIFNLMYGASTPEGIAGLEVNDYNLLQNWRHGALIASIDNKHWVNCGFSCSITSTHGGTLVLNINDRKQQDNTGSYSVNVRLYRTK